MPRREHMRSGLWLTLNIAATVALFYSWITLYRGQYWVITLNTLVQLWITTLYRRGFTTHFGVLNAPRSRFDVSNDQLNTEKTHNGSLPDGAYPQHTQVVASVVGWREDPLWYTKCLNSLVNNWNCEILVAGIDGNEPEDEQMVDVFRTVGLTGSNDDFSTSAPELKTILGLPQRPRNSAAKDTVQCIERNYLKQQPGRC